MIICKASLFLVLICQVFASTGVAKAKSSAFYETILCRYCGQEISNTKDIEAKTSPYSEYSFYDTIFHLKQDVLVQMFTDLLIFHYPMIILSESSCSGIGEWEKSTWFPGYLSRPCTCPECGAHIGFEYQPMKLDDSGPFFGLFLPAVIGENCKYIL